MERNRGKRRRARHAEGVFDVGEAYKLRRQAREQELGKLGAASDVRKVTVSPEMARKYLGVK